MEECSWTVCQITDAQRRWGRWKNFSGLLTEASDCARNYQKLLTAEIAENEPEVAKKTKNLRAAFFLCRQTNLFPRALWAFRLGLVSSNHAIILIGFADCAE